MTTKSKKTIIPADEELECKTSIQGIMGDEIEIVRKIPKISQSLVKSLFAYKEKQECGLMIKAKYVDGMMFPSTPAQELGNYFEYICTGSKARDGHTPEAKILKSGKVATDYARMNVQKENFDRIMKTYGFEIEFINHKFTSERFSGIADIVAKNNKGERVVIDIKSSGMINDKFSDYGWEESGMEYKDKLLLQAVHYKILAEEEWDIHNIPFYFFVFSTKNETDFKIYEIICDEATLQTHANNFIEAEKYFASENEKGWTPYPDLKRCAGCPLKEGCKFFVDVPMINKVYY